MDRWTAKLDQQPSGPFDWRKRASSLLAAAKTVNPRNQGQDNVITAAFSSSSNDRPPPPPPGAARIRRTEQASSAPVLFPAGTPYAEALVAHQKAPLAMDAAL